MSVKSVERQPMVRSAPSSPWCSPCPPWRARKWWSWPTAHRSPSTISNSARSWRPVRPTKVPNRQQIINDLIDDRLKIARAKVYGLEVGDAEVNNAFESMATRQHITPAQFAQVLERAGISPNTVKARIRAELTWQQLIRGKYNSSLQVGESDIANALKDRNENEAAAVGYIYTLYPVVIVVARGSSEATCRPSAARPKTCVAGSSPATRALPWRAACATWRCAIRSPETPPT